MGYETRLTFQMKDPLSPEVMELLFPSRHKLRDRLNLRWKTHRDPGGWDDPLPQAWIIDTRSGGRKTRMTLIGHATPGYADDTKTEFQITAVPAAWRGDPAYYLPGETWLPYKLPPCKKWTPIPWGQKPEFTRHLPTTHG